MAAISHPVELSSDDDQTASENEVQLTAPPTRRSGSRGAQPQPRGSTTAAAGSKRKKHVPDAAPPPPSPGGERVEWTSDSDDAGGAQAALRARKKKAAQRRSGAGRSSTTATAASARGRQQDKADADQRKLQRQQRRDVARAVDEGFIPGPSLAAATGGGGGGGRRGRRSGGALTKARAADDESDDDEDGGRGPRIAPYLRKRRREFDAGLEARPRPGGAAEQALRMAGLRLPPDYSDVYFSDDERIAELEERPQFGDGKFVKPRREYRDVELEHSAGLIPAGVAQYLRDYQVEGVRFMHHLFVYQKGGILGDDMGLGKTVQVAAFLTVAFGKTGDERDAKRMRKMRRMDDDRWYPRVLVVCPGSLIQNWKNELDRWGYWHVDLYHGPGREDVLNAARNGRIEIMITTYGTYKNSRAKVNDVEWDCVVADECHVMKERTSEVTRAMDEVNALCRIGLTGTAIQNRYEELWTLLNWTNPGHFGTAAEWERTICTPLKLGQSHDATLSQLSLARKTAKKLVQNLLPPFLLRRMKTLIADQLPRKSDKVVFCPLTDAQRSAYDNFLRGWQAEFLRAIYNVCDCGSGTRRGWCCYKLLPTGATWQTIVFPVIIALQKLSSHLALLIPATADPSPKLESELAVLRECLPDTWEDFYRSRDSLVNLANPEFCGKWKILRKLLRFWHGNGDKVLVFSHSVRLLRILQHLFHNTRYSVSFLDGSLSYEDRQRVVDDFNSDPAQFVFLISTKAGGVGLNIASANKVVIVDPHWNPAYDLQAQDRAYRIGQTRDVDVFRLVSAGTIEEIVYARQVYKQQQANIGYSASTERRYFKGVQRDKTRKGELFGLDNMLTFHADESLLKGIVNKTNIAEAKAGENLALADVDMEQLARDQDLLLPFLKGAAAEDGGPGAGDAAAAGRDGGGLGQLAKYLKHEKPDGAVTGADDDYDDFYDSDDSSNEKKKKNKSAMQPPPARPPPRKSDAIQAILAAAGVQYTHENSEVVGSSRVEAQLSRRAEQLVDVPVDGGGGANPTAADGADAAAEGNVSVFEPDQKQQQQQLGAAGDDPATTPPLDLSTDPMALAIAARPLFAESQASLVLPPLPLFPHHDKEAAAALHLANAFQYRYRPPDDVKRRQFCTMAAELGFDSVTDFALVVEGWTQAQRRDCLDLFYRRREEARLRWDAFGDESGLGKEEAKKEDGKKEEAHGDEYKAKMEGGDVDVDTEGESEDEGKPKSKVELVLDDNETDDEL